MKATSGTKGETTGRRGLQGQKTADELPTRVGHFTLIRPLGEGGMGIVYLAEQEEPVQRQVALKLLRTTLLDQSSRLRFESERQALARLAHPHIAQLFEAGTTGDGHPFFAMERVEGTPITRYCDDRQLGLSRRLELFADVCEGVQHAHQKGIIHRDLKPSNVLVAEIGGRAVPKIIDFGIAKALAQPLVGDQGLTGDSLLGTPAYIAPEIFEQLGGEQDPDTRADVYSLGVMLYELLVGVLPYESTGKPLPVFMQRIIGKEPTCPSIRWRQLDDDTRRTMAERRKLQVDELRRHLQGELDWIVLKAMASDRDRRYGSPAELAADIGRHLRHEPVEAGPESGWYRLRKAARRHRGATVAAGLVTLSLAAGVVAFKLEAERANRQAEAARQAQLEAEEVTRFMTDLFELADPGETYGRRVTALELLDRGADTIGGELTGQPLVRSRLLQTMGAAYSGLGQYQRAATLIEESLAIRNHLGEDNPAENARALNDLGEVYRLLGRMEDATAVFDRATELAARAGADERALRGETANNLGLLMQDQGRYEAAEALFQSALADLEAELGPESRLVATVFNNLGSVSGHLGRREAAEAYHARALEIFEQELGPRHPDVAMSLNNLALIRKGSGRLDEAEAMFLRAREIWVAALGPEHPNVATSLSNLASLYTTLERYDEAASLLEQALEISERQLGANHPATARWCYNLAQVRKKKGDLEAALPLLERALATFESALGGAHVNLSFPLLALADVHRLDGAPDRAREFYRRAIAVREGALPAGHRLIEDALNEYAEFLRGTGDEGELQLIENRLLQLAADRARSQSE